MIECVIKRIKAQATKNTADGVTPEVLRFERRHAVTGKPGECAKPANGKLKQNNGGYVDLIANVFSDGSKAATNKNGK